MDAEKFAPTGSGADMLKPLAIGVIGALCFSMLFSLIATPVLYRVLAGRKATGPQIQGGIAANSELR